MDTYCVWMYMFVCNVCVCVSLSVSLSLHRLQTKSGPASICI